MAFRYLDKDGALSFWTNIKNFILSKIPTKTSELTNDSGFLTQHQSLSNYVTLNSEQTITGKKLFTNATTKVNSVNTFTGSTQFIDLSTTVPRGSFPESAHRVGRVYIGDNTSYNGSWFIIDPTIDTDKAYYRMVTTSPDNSDSTRFSITWDSTKEGARRRRLVCMGDLICATNNTYQIGESGNVWKGVYATNYYYGSDAVEFSSKFVTTDTTQTITGVKTFASSPLIYNSDTTGSVPQLTLKNSKTAKGSTTETGAQLIYFADKNNAPLSMIESRVVSNGCTTLSTVAYNFNDSQNVSSSVQLIKNPTTAYYAPGEDNDISLGRASARWLGVYATNYYYGADNVEFSTKFITTDTAQTISGAKTFSSTITGSISGNASTATEFSANKDVTLTGDVTGTASSKAGWSVSTTLSNSGVTAGTYGPSEDVTGNNNATISVPEITVDSKGRVTSVTNRTLTCKNNTYNVYNKTLTIQKNGTNVATFTSNSNTNVTANITVPTKTSELTNDSNFLTTSSSLNASKLTGTIDIARLPQGALERVITVADQTARFALTTSSVQLGDTVKQLDTSVMYVVVNESKLNSNDGYLEYTAGSASSVPWSGITSKPTEFTPSSHTHTKSEITDLPTNVSAFTNDAGYLTSHQSLSNYVTIDTAQDIEGNKNFKGLLTTIPNDTIWPVTASTTDDITFLGANAIHVEQKGSGKLTDLSNGAWSVAELGVGCFFFRINNGTDIRYKHLGQNTVNRIPVVSGANRFINDVTPNENNTYSLGTSSLRWSSCYSNAYYLGTTAFGDIVTHNASEFLTEHPSITLSSNTTSTASPAHGGTFTCIDSVTQDTNGHITKVNTKTVTLPSDNNTDTKVKQYEGTTNQERPILSRYNSTEASQTANFVVYDTGVTSNPAKHTITASGGFIGNASSATEFKDSKSVTLTGDVTGTVSSKAGWSVATTLANSGVTAGTYGPSADVTGSNNATILVPEITVDAKGRVTSVTNRTYTSVNTDTNTDTKVTQTVTNDNACYPLLIANTASASHTGLEPTTETDEVRKAYNINVHARYGFIYARNSYTADNLKGSVAGGNRTSAAFYGSTYDGAIVGGVELGRVDKYGNRYSRLYATNYITDGALAPDGTAVATTFDVGVLADGTKYLNTSAGWYCNVYPTPDNTRTLGTSSLRWKECYCNAYYLGTTAFGDIVTHNASEFLTSHQSLSSCVKNVVTNNQTIKSTAITRGTAPSSEQTFGIAFSDNNNKYIGNIYGLYAPNKAIFVGLYAYKGTTTSNGDNVSVRVGYDASGNAYTYAPTPATADNSTQIATTAFVKAQGYLTSHQSLANYVTTNTDQSISGIKSHSKHISILGDYIGNEFSTNARTCLYLKSNRDTDGQSGIYFSKYRQNRAQGALTGSDLVSFTLDVLENSVRTNNCISVDFRYFENDIPTKIYVVPKASATSYMGTAGNPWTNAYITNLNLNGNSFDPTSIDGVGTTRLLAYEPASATDLSNPAGTTKPGSSLYDVRMTLSNSAGHYGIFDSGSNGGFSVIIDGSITQSGTWKVLHYISVNTPQTGTHSFVIAMWVRIA